MARGNRLLQAAINLAKSRKKPRIPVYSILGEQFGPAGRLLGGLIDVFRLGGRVTEEDVSESKRLMEDIGLPLSPSSVRSVDLREWAAQQGLDPESQFLVDTIPDYRLKMLSPGSPEELPPTKGGLPGPRSRTSVPDIDTDRGRETLPLIKRIRQVASPGTSRRKRPGQDQDPRFNNYGLGDLMPPGPGGTDVFANEVRFPQSSNVYAMAYDEVRGILYVSYRVNVRVPGRIYDVSSCTGKEHSYLGKVDERGPMYAYGGPGNPVPASLWESAKGAASAGKFVWNRLRVCGDFNGHQYKYSLVSPSMSGSLYVPRKEVISRDPNTNEGGLGFRVRSVPTVGRSKRPYTTSDGDYVT